MDENIKRAKKLLESAGYESKKDYSMYTPDMLDDELDLIEDTIDDIVGDLKHTHYDDDAYDDLLDHLEDLSDNLYELEDYLDDEQLQKQQSLLSAISNASETEYEGPHSRRDPYAERGLKQSDFY